MKQISVCLIAVLTSFLFCTSAYGGVDDGLVAYYPLNGGANDDSGNGYHGNINGEVNFIPSTIGQAADFDGFGDSITTNEILSFNPDDKISISLWFNLRISRDDSSVLVYLGDSPSERVASCFVQTNSSKIVCGVFNNNVSDWMLSPEPITFNQSYHLAYIYDGTNQSMYLNGQLIESRTRTANLNPENIIGRIGESYNNRYYWDGIIDEVRIYNRALTECEIQELYSGNIADADGDGITTCDGDCNDNDPKSFPGATEICDGIDNDCNGEIPDDEIIDSDGDSFVECNDCDDSNPEIHPDALEIPSNFEDENCDGNLGDCWPCLSWKNHGQYVRCTAHAVEELVTAGFLTEDEGDTIVSSAAQSQIGKKGYLPEECQ